MSHHVVQSPNIDNPQSHQDIDLRPAKILRGAMPKDEPVEPPKISHLAQVPFEIIAEILSHTASPRDVLALARCSKYFCATLVTNQSSLFIWRRARKQCLPQPVPNPTPNFTEAAYAAYLFDGGPCEICKKKTKAMYTSFSTRLRLCGKDECKSKAQDLFVILSPGQEDRYSDITNWLPPMEKRYTLSTSSVFRMYRKADWELAKNEFNRVMLTPETSAEYLKEKQRLADRLPMLLDHANALCEWRYTRSLTLDEIKASNDKVAKDYAKREGWSSWDLLQTESYGLLTRSKTVSLELLTLADLTRIHSTMERQIIKNAEHRDRQQKERAYKKHREEVETHYNRLRSASGQPNGVKHILPPLNEFRKLPIIKSLQAKSGVEGVVGELKNLTFVNGLLQDDLKRWADSAREALANILGQGGWKSASNKKLHPSERLTARFRCKRCDQSGKKGAKMIESLDLEHACVHRCPHLSKSQKATEVWKADNFEPDLRAIGVVQQVLTAAGIDAEDKESINAIKQIEDRILCISCPVPMVMDFNMLLRHCQRHNEPRIAILSPEAAIEILKPPLQHGLYEQLMRTGNDAEKQRNRMVYGCRHCLRRCACAVEQSEKETVPRPPVMEDVGDGLAGGAANNHPSGGSQSPEAGGDKDDQSPKVGKLFDFNGLRSHVKTKHGVSFIGDEDFLRKEA